MIAVFVYVYIKFHTALFFLCVSYDQKSAVEKMRNRLAAMGYLGDNNNTNNKVTNSSSSSDSTPATANNTAANTPANSSKEQPMATLTAAHSKAVPSQQKDTSFAIQQRQQEQMIPPISLEQSPNIRKVLDT
jgi:hypothetical protein